jgi:hypothetical protein
VFGSIWTTELIVFVLAVLGVLTVLYFLPTIIAVKRQKANVTPIVLVDLLLGWTVIGWIVALIWALSTQVVDKEPATGSESLLCAQCGKYSQGGSKFCAHCGAVIAAS